MTSTDYIDIDYQQWHWTGTIQLPITNDYNLLLLKRDKRQFLMAVFLHMAKTNDLSHWLKTLFITHGSMIEHRSLFQHFSIFESYRALKVILFEKIRTLEFLITKTQSPIPNTNPKPQSQFLKLIPNYQSLARSQSSILIPIPNPNCQS